jgi:hypothetical protein
MRIIFTANALSQIWNGTGWDDANYYSFVWDANNDLISFLIQNYSSSVLVNNAQTTYAYDGQHNQIYSLYQSWTGTSWLTSGETTSSFDSNGFMIH